MTTSVVSARTLLSYYADGSRAVPREAIREARVPVLILHGRNDTEVTPRAFSEGWRATRWRRPA